VYFNVNFNVFFKLIKVHFLVSELYIYQNARCNDYKKLYLNKYLSPICSAGYSLFLLSGNDQRHLIQTFKTTGDKGKPTPYILWSLHKETKTMDNF